MPTDRWICVLVSYRYLITKGFEQLDELFFGLMGKDYIENCPVDPGNDDGDDTTSCYVLLHCWEYEKYLPDFRVCPYLRGVLNTYKDVHEMTPEEIGAIRKTPSHVVHDGGHTVNRTGLFMPGDIVQVKSGPCARVQGIVISEKKGVYAVFFRLFMRSFKLHLHAHDLEFVSSIFRFYKFPVTRSGLTKSRKLADFIVSTYRRLLQAQISQQLIPSERK